MEPKKPGRRIFIDITTGQRYFTPEWDAIPAERSVDEQPPWPNGKWAYVFYEDGPQTGRETRVEGKYLEEEVPVLKEILLHQADNWENTQDLKWHRYGRNEAVRIATFNPYVREKYVIEYHEFMETKRVFHHTAVNFNDLSKQTADVVFLWLAATGYNLKTMNALARTNRHFARLMRLDNIWRRALIHNYGHMAVRNMAPRKMSKELGGGYAIKMDPWLEVQLYGFVEDEKEEERRRYFKRLYELFMRARDPTTVGVMIESLTERKPRLSMKQANYHYPICIWQCRNYIYGLFSQQPRAGKSYRGEVLFFWNARKEDPFDAANRKKRNLLDVGETFEYVYHDVRGYLCRVNGKLLFSFADHPLETAERVPYARNFSATRELPSSSSRGIGWLMPDMVCLEHAIIPRSCIDQELGAPVKLHGDFRVVAVLDPHRILVKALGDGSHFYQVTDPLRHPVPDANWMAVRSVPEHMESERTFNLICHYRRDTNTMEWHDYQPMVLGSPYDAWKRKRLAGLKFTSSRIIICDQCKVATAIVECGHDCGTAYYCGQECADAHYEKHECVAMKTFIK